MAGPSEKGGVRLLDHGAFESARLWRAISSLLQSLQDSADRMPVQHHGFKATTQSCCGVGGKYSFAWAAQCGLTGHVNGKSVGSCLDPAFYIIWDGINLTDQANRVLTKQILRAIFILH